MINRFVSALRLGNWSAKTIRAVFLCIAVILSLSICYDFGTEIFTPKKTFAGLSFVPLPRGKILIAGISNVGETLFEEIRVGDVILGVEGMELSSSNGPVVSDSLGRIEVGEMIELQLYRDRSVITRRVLNRYYTLDEKITMYLTTIFGDAKQTVEFIVGLLFIIIGYIVVLANPSGRIQRRFAVASIAVFLFFCRSVLPIDVVIGYFVPGALTSQAPWFVGYSVLLGTVNFIAGSLMLYYFAFPVHTPPSSKWWFPIAL
ncbi:MAG: hypothetical protein CL946_03420, partial [Ectothiorhodospiraceae bacterium]|nr:hypothetical protein [Ectothiorhodospiraceae bacterium]